MTVIVNLSHFRLMSGAPFINVNSRSFRPPSWPPARDWVCIEDKDGNVISHYGDHVWNFTPWCKKTETFSFGDGPKLHARSLEIDPANAELLRQLVAWRCWGPRASPSVRSLLSNFAVPFRQIIKICSDNNILASDLWRYPVVIEKVALSLPNSKFGWIIGELERLRDARDFLGFELLDAAGIQRLKAAQPRHDKEQTEYIPPRIWTYVVNRVADCINDYCTHQEKIEACFAFCIDAYAQSGSNEYQGKIGKPYRKPLNGISTDTTKSRFRSTQLSPFADTAQRYGIKDVLERWSGKISRKRGISAFTNYLQLIRYVALIDITAFTLMRVDEAASVRFNCLLWHDDPVYGRIPLLQSETTKTDPDDNGLWITSPSIEPAIRALRSIAKMRLSSAGKWSEKSNPNLIVPAFEPWAGGPKSAQRFDVKPYTSSLSDVVSHFPFLFDFQQLTINEDDFRIAKAVCPTLNDSRFRVGEPWTLAWHQFRRTGAVNMFSSGEISDSSIQLQLKHLTRWQPLYYGRGNTALHLNDAARVLLVNAQYESMSRQLSEVHTTNHYISPYGDEHKAKLLAAVNGGEPVNLVSNTDARLYEKAARKHLINFRQTVLGGCMKNSQCEGDCVSSVGDCAGGNGKLPCINVLFDRTRASVNQTRLESVIKQLEEVASDTPRYRFLEQEKRGLENYFAYIGKAT